MTKCRSPAATQYCRRFLIFPYAENQKYRTLKGAGVPFIKIFATGSREIIKQESHEQGACFTAKLAA
ncbi:hypothetical protein C0081_10575 [Cohaesibacter celericrescens]|uniref:Uncharacterized protein n=1 Tax=Cohaesibacter celericrescens TaxID=2067669 RepID=A0A2N5XRV9_9HYPH|nr:hypothetical protein C0081_10575 [Cohaesibacter celericrescens]